MRDALGQVQSVLVLGGTSEIAVATVNKIVASRGARVELAARKPESCDRPESSILANSLPLPTS